MKKLQNIYLCGLGALGGMYAARFMETPVDNVRVIADAGRIRRYQQEGVSVNGRILSLSYLRPDEQAPPADLILVAVKWRQLGDAIQAIRSFVGPHTIILSLLNGIESEEVIGGALGMDKVLYSFVVETDATRKGRDIQYGTLGTVVFGERNNESDSLKVAAMREFFERTGVAYRVPENIMRELWWKFMLNVGVNQTSAVMRAPYGRFQQSAEARQAMRLTCREVVRVAEKAGVDLAEEDIETFFPILNNLRPEKKTSMLQDVEACRKTEVEIFGGTVVAMGRRYSVPTPVNETLVNMISAMELAFQES